MDQRWLQSPRFRAMLERATAEDGATSIEYGLIAALISIAAVASFKSIGNSVIALLGVAADGFQ